MLPPAALNRPWAAQCTGMSLRGGYPPYTSAATGGGVTPLRPLRAIAAQIAGGNPHNSLSLLRGVTPPQLLRFVAAEGGQRGPQKSQIWV